MTHTLFVCTTCASTWQDGKRVGESGGEKLLKQLEQLSWEQTQFPIVPVACMSACSRPCTVSFAAVGKPTYLFGDLAASDAEAILQCASQYYSTPDGVLPWKERPEPLKKGIIARIPPLPARDRAN